MEKILPINLKDFDEIKNLLFSRWPDFEEWFDEDKLKSYIKNGHDYCIKFTEKGKIVGVLLGEKHRESAYVRAILVAENYRQKGIGRKLLVGIEEAAKKNNLKTVYLESGDRDYKKRAFQFYNALGYEVKGYAHIHGESLIFFEKEL